MTSDRGAAPPKRLVTVDGPAGSGKTTLGRRLAGLLGVPLIDTGLLYRAVTVAAARAGYGPDDGERLADLALRARIEVGTDPSDTAPAIRIDGEDVSASIRDPGLAPLLAAVSRNPGVRAALLAPQRRLAPHGEAVAVGRDCGTVVFPGAPVKLYLDAPAAVREARRARQLSDGSGAVAPATLTAEVEDRDRSDARRSDAPMRPAADALLIWTDRVGVEEMVALAAAACRDAGLPVA
ncbi:MAG: (d)CMP kinase [Candidatus Dormibacteraeota bacterium]|nr:(d)CMP kinase [Candidatus Dormibacteraeota bacterium]